MQCAWEEKNADGIVEFYQVSIPYRVHVIFDEEKDTNKTIIVSIPYRVHVIMINVLSNLILFILRLFQFLIGFM